MRITRHAPLILVLPLLAACAAAGLGTSEPAEPDPAEAVEGEVTEAEPAEPEPTLEDRWRAPFSVMSRGRPAPRLERPVVVAVPAHADTVPASARDSAAVSSGAIDAAPDSTATVVVDTAVVAEGGDSEPETSEAGLRTHRVERGETWFGIARRYGLASAALAAVNPDIDPERLRAGAVLVIPSADAPAAGRRTHTVVAGDSLWGISRRYGVSIERLREVNRLDDERIRVGQVLIIP